VCFVYLPVRVCIRVCLCVCACVCICMYVCACLYMYVCVYVYMCVCARACVCICVWVCACARVYIWLYLRICASVCVYQQATYDFLLIISDCINVYLFTYFQLYLFHVSLWSKYYIPYQSLIVLSVFSCLTNYINRYTTDNYTDQWTDKTVFNKFSLHGLSQY